MKVGLGGQRAIWFLRHRRTTVISKLTGEILAVPGARYIGWDEADLLGQPVLRLIPVRYHEAHMDGLHHLADTGQARISGKTLRAAYRDGSGLERPCTVSAERMGNVFLAVITPSLRGRKPR